MLNRGILIISLDFELHWGVFKSVTADSPYMKNLLNTPIVIDRLLEVFEKRNISATWAVVGFLFAESSDVLKKFVPPVKPGYVSDKSNPFIVMTGHDENDDPIHFAPSLIRKIRSNPNQEVATHTFSHFLCSEEGATIEAFLSDLESAVNIAADYGIKYNCIVFPRDQLIREYINVLPARGIKVFRGGEKGWMYSKIKYLHEGKINKFRKFLNKFGRILDTYLPLTGSNTWDTNELKAYSSQPINVPASRFMRPYNPALKNLNWLKYLRIAHQIKHAARNGKMVHLHWHPHNFGSNIDENFKFLIKILDCFENCRTEYNMRSMTMSEYADLLLLIPSVAK